MFMPLPLKPPVLNVSTLLGSEAGKRMTVSPKALSTQMRSCWSTARWNGAPLAHNAALRPITLGKVHELVLGNAENPHVTVGGDDDTLHQAKLMVKRDAVRRRQRFAVLVENRDRLSAVTVRPKGCRLRRLLPRTYRLPCRHRR